jgi:hypothetical protein
MMRRRPCGSAKTCCVPGFMIRCPTGATLGEAGPLSGWNGRERHSGLRPISHIFSGVPAGSPGSSPQPRRPRRG